jgi:hypothetical protein
MVLTALQECGAYSIASAMALCRVESTMDHGRLFRQRSSSAVLRMSDGHEGGRLLHLCTTLGREVAADRCLSGAHGPTQHGAFTGHRCWTCACRPRYLSNWTFTGQVTVELDIYPRTLQVPTKVSEAPGPAPAAASKPAPPGNSITCERTVGPKLARGTQHVRPVSARRFERIPSPLTLSGNLGKRRSAQRLALDT